jgi:hypothetical protein
MHGGADKAVNPEHSLSLAQQLQRVGKVYELIVYAEDGHIHRNQVDRDQRATSWFKKFSKVTDLKIRGNSSFAAVRQLPTILRMTQVGRGEN